MNWLSCWAAKCLNLVLSCSKFTESSAAFGRSTGAEAGWANRLIAHVCVPALQNCFQLLYWALDFNPTLVGLPALPHFYETKVNVTSFMTGIRTLPGTIKSESVGVSNRFGSFKGHHPPSAYHLNKQLDLKTIARSFPFSWAASSISWSSFWWHLPFF